MQQNISSGANESLTLADLIKIFMLRLKPQMSLSQLAKISGINYRTLHNWERGTSAKAQEWQPIVRLARGLQLSEVETSQLLQAAGWPSVSNLFNTSMPDSDRDLFRWLQSTDDSHPQEPDVRQESNRINLLWVGLSSLIVLIIIVGQCFIWRSTKQLTTQLHRESGTILEPMVTIVPTLVLPDLELARLNGTYLLLKGEQTYSTDLPSNVNDCTPAFRVKVGTTLEAQFMVRNRAGKPYIIPQLLAASRRIVQCENDWDNPEVDFVGIDQIVLGSQETYTYRQQQVFDEPGIYFVQPIIQPFYPGTSEGWGISPDPRLYFEVVR